MLILKYSVPDYVCASRCLPNSINDTECYMISEQKNWDAMMKLKKKKTNKNEQIEASYNQKAFRHIAQSTICIGEPECFLDPLCDHYGCTCTLRR